MAARWKTGDNHVYVLFFSFFWIQIKLWAFNLTSKLVQPLILDGENEKATFFLNKAIENALSDRLFWNWLVKILKVLNAHARKLITYNTGLTDNWIYMPNLKIVKYCTFLMETVVLARHYKRYDFKTFPTIIYVMH